MCPPNLVVSKNGHSPLFLWNRSLCQCYLPKSNEPTTLSLQALQSTIIIQARFALEQLEIRQLSLCHLPTFPFSQLLLPLASSFPCATHPPFPSLSSCSKPGSLATRSDQIIKCPTFSLQLSVHHESVSVSVAAVLGTHPRCGQLAESRLQD